MGIRSWLTALQTPLYRHKKRPYIESTGMSADDIVRARLRAEREANAVPELKPEQVTSTTIDPVADVRRRAQLPQRAPEPEPRTPKLPVTPVEDVRRRKRIQP